MISLISRFSWLIVLLATGTMLAMVGLLVLTSGGIDVLGLRNNSAIAPAQVSVGPASGNQVSVTGPAPLNSVLPKRLLFANVPLPQEVSRRPDVIATNVVLAIILTLAFGTAATVLNNIVREQGGTFLDWLKAVHFGWLANLIMSGSKRAIHRGCLGLPIIMLIFAMYGIIFATLEPGTSILSPDGVQLAIALAMSVGLISLGGDAARRWLARLWHSKSRYGVHPASLLLAIGTTVMSRVFRLSPGILFGVPGGAEIELGKEGKRIREIILAFTTLATVLVLGAFGWIATGIIAQVGTRTVNADILTFWGPIARFAQTIGLAIFVLAVQTAFFDMIPLGATLGGKICRWSGIAWTITFVPMAFIFTHTILNPNSDFLSAFQSANVRATVFLTAALVIVTLFVWLYVRITLPRSRPAFAKEDTQPTGAYRYEPPAPVAPSRSTDTHPAVPSSTDSPTFLTLRIKIPGFRPPEDEDPVFDTRPGQIQEPPVDKGDTKPGKPVDEDISEPPDYNDRVYRYDNLFPPPKPGDEDYLESGFSEDKSDHPKPPDSLPL